MTVVVFTVPPGVRPGQQIVVQAPNRQRVTVQLPPNTRVGQRMQVNVPDSQPEPPAPAPTHHSMAPPSGPAAPSGDQPAGQGTSLFEFVVPPRAQPFQRLLVQVPSGQRVNVQLPAGAVPGMRMRVAVPIAPHGVTLPPIDAVAKLLGERSGMFHSKLIALRKIIGDCRAPAAHLSQPSQLQMSLRRDRILEDTLWHFLKEPMKNVQQLQKKSFMIKFVGEDGIDQGGLTREFYCVIMHAFVDPSPALFSSSATSDYAYQVNPLSTINPEHLQYFELLGKVMAKSIIDGVQIDVHFCSAFYKGLLGIKLGEMDLESVDVELYKGLMFVRETEDVEALCLSFETSFDEFGVSRDEELKPGGADIDVTDENKEEFIELKAVWRMSKRVSEQVAAVKKGFFSVLPERAFMELDLDARELELVLCGIPTIDIDDWHKNTEYKSGYSEAHPTVQNFWKLMGTWDDEMRAAVLRFVTGTPKVPVEGFGALKGSDGPKRFTLQKVEWKLDRLPQAATCFNTIYLPPFKTYDSLKEKLEFAVTEAAEGFGLK